MSCTGPGTTTLHKYLNTRHSPVKSYVLCCSWLLVVLLLFRYNNTVGVVKCYSNSLFFNSTLNWLNLRLYSTNRFFFFKVKGIYKYIYIGLYIYTYIIVRRFRTSCFLKFLKVQKTDLKR